MHPRADALTLAGPIPALAWLAALLLLTGLAGPAASSLARFGADLEQHGSTETWVEEGLVSWYGPRFHGRPTASGEIFDSGELTMAHPSLPFGSRVRVTNLSNGREVVVRVNDRGPFVDGRIADLSRAAAADLGMVRRGVATARLALVEDDEEPERRG
jgi:rare lipoprotein A